MENNLNLDILMQGKGMCELRKSLDRMPDIATVELRVDFLEV